jgi:hypothetical protein
MNLEEIDRLVAERVMGWHLETIPASGFDDEWRNWCEPSGPGVYSELEFAPSSDWQYAGLVLEKLLWLPEYQVPDVKVDGPFFKPLGQYITLKATMEEECWWFRVSTKGWKKVVVGDTLPIAICLAALLKVGVDPEKPS